MKVSSVTVRMYDTGSIGDCLLFLFHKYDNTTFKMLVDCGGWNTQTSAITKCAKDIYEVAPELDLLVATHQHLDHISGFNQALPVFTKIKVKEVWMSWVENESDSIANIVKETYGKQLKQAKKLAVSALAALQKQAGRQSNVKNFNARMKKKVLSTQQTIELLDFELGSLAGRDAAARRSNNDAMAFLKKKGKKLRYLKPGTVLDDIGGAEGIKFYVLGPPRDADMRYFKIDREEEQMFRMQAEEEEEEFVGENEEYVFSSKFIIPGIALVNDVSPFGSHFKMNRKEMNDFNKRYHSSDYRWRQIETDWQETGAAIAMRVNRLVNNTSLALAIEFGNGKVILLPGDAQSGNWMGWHKKSVSKRLKNKGGKNTTELLANTVLYKVGHHGSENGTASRCGLDQMVHPDLVAMMPLIGAKVPDGWGGEKNFPAKPLYRELIRKTRGRVIRNDEGIVNDPAAQQERAMLSTGERQSFASSFRRGSCYVEYTLKL